MNQPLIPVTKITSSGHSQRYWMTPEQQDGSRVLPSAKVSGAEERNLILPTTKAQSNWAYNDRGLKWQSIKNPEFRRLAEDRAAEYDDGRFDTYDEFYDNHDGSIELTFYSQGASVTLRRIDSEAIGVFKHGMCGLLAYGLNEITDAPVMVFTNQNEDEQGWTGHAGLATDDGRFLDINGIHDIDDIKKEYPNAGEPLLMNGTDFLQLISGDTENPIDDLDTLERLVVMDFAEHVLNTYIEGY